MCGPCKYHYINALQRQHPQRRGAASPRSPPGRLSTSADCCTLLLCLCAGMREYLGGFMCRQPLLQRLLLPSHHQAVPALPSRLPGPLHPRWEYSGVPNVLMVRKLLLFNWPPTLGRGGDVHGNMPAACCPCPNPRGFLDLCISGGNILMFHTSWCSLYYTHIHTLSVLFVMPSANPCLRAASCLPARAPLPLCPPPCRPASVRLRPGAQMPRVHQAVFP